MLARTVRFFRERKVRVVNMSWMRPESGFLGELVRCAPSLATAERAAIARYAVDTLRRAMTADALFSSFRLPTPNFGVGDYLA
jgi:hypothetical protein